jgi:hypothetical protein
LNFTLAIFFAARTVGRLSIRVKDTFPEFSPGADRCRGSEGARATAWPRFRYYRANVLIAPELQKYFRKILKFLQRISSAKSGHPLV